MVKTSDFFKEDTLRKAKELLVARSSDGQLEPRLVKLLSNAEQNEDAKEKIIALSGLGRELAKHCVNPKEIPVGVGLLLKAIELYDERSGKDLRSERLDDEYFGAKELLATIFLPKVPFINDIVKTRVEDFIEEDAELGLSMLKDVLTSSHAHADGFLMLSAMYATGTVVDWSMDLARKYYAKAIELDGEECWSISQDFRDYYDQILHNNGIANDLRVEKIRKDSWAYAEQIAKTFGTTAIEVSKCLRQIPDDAEGLAKHPNEIQAIERLFAAKEELGKVFLWNSLSHFGSEADKKLPEEARRFFSDELWAFLRKDWDVIRHKYRYTGNKNGPIETERLILEPMTLECNRMYNEILRLGHDYEDYYNSEYKEVSLMNRPFHYAIVEKESKRFIGTIGMNHITNRGDWLSVEYIIFSEFRRKGYAKEALLRLTDFIFSGKAIKEERTPYECVFETKPFVPPYLEADAWIENHASRKTLESCGFVYDRTLEGDEGMFILKTGKKEPAVYYRLTAERWNQIKNQ